MFLRLSFRRLDYSRIEYNLRPVSAIGLPRPILGCMMLASNQLHPEFIYRSNNLINVET